MAKQQKGMEKDKMKKENKLFNFQMTKYKINTFKTALSKTAFTSVVLNQEGKLFFAPPRNHTHPQK